MSNETDAIFSGLNAVGKKWKKAKRQSDKEDRLSRKQIKYTYWKPEKHYMNDVCNANMEKVYNQVSSNGKYYANARQLMYKMRPIVLQECGRIWKNDTYFTGVLRFEIQ